MSRRSASARKAMTRAGAAGCTAERLPWPAATFDLVVSTTSFDHWADQRAGLAECARVLAPGGCLYGFEDLVDEIIYSHECGTSKPDPGIYALTCERLRVEPAQMVFLDDSGPCVEGARQAGIHAVLYQDNSQAVSDIEDLLAAPAAVHGPWY